jgi:hypothetical protein
MDATAIDHHDDRFPRAAEDRHHLMDILAKPLGLKVGNDFKEDFRRPIWTASRTLSNTPLGTRLQLDSASRLGV